MAAWTPYYRKLMGRIPLQIEISGLCTSHIAERYITACYQPTTSENFLRKWILFFLFQSPFSFKNSVNWLWSSSGSKYNTGHSRPQKPKRKWEMRNLLLSRQGPPLFPGSLLRFPTESNPQEYSFHRMDYCCRVGGKDTFGDKYTLVKNFIFSFRSSCCSLSV